MLLAGLVLAAGLSLGRVVVVANLVVSVVIGPAEPAPRVETWLSVLVESPVVAVVTVVGAGLVPVVVGAATWAVVVGPAPPPPLAINGTTMAAATITARYHNADHPRAPGARAGTGHLLGRMARLVMGHTGIFPQRVRP